MLNFASPDRTLPDFTARFPQLPSASVLFTAGALAVAAAVGIALPLVGLEQMRWVVAGAVGLVGTGMLFTRPGIATALFLFAGLFKSDPTLSAFVPFDLTAAIAGLLTLACFVKLFRSGRFPEFPKAYALYLPILLLMIASLLYTPSFATGADKLMKFALFTGLGITCPFVLFDSVRQIRVFFFTLALLGLILSSQALTGLGGSARLVAHGTLTIQLGVAAGTVLALALGFFMPSLSFRRRVVLYPIAGAAAIALLGSGARGPLIGVVCCALFALWYFKQLWLDMGIFALAGSIGLAKVGIPAASISYLSTLVSGDASAMGTRTGLMGLAWRLFREHPLLGVGIGGFGFYTRDAENTFPHNLFLEIGAELGFFALIAFTALVLWASWEAYRQLRQRGFPYAREAAGVFSLLIFSFIQMVKSGDMNDNRTMWLLVGLPFLLRSLAEREASRTPDAGAA